MRTISKIVKFISRNKTTINGDQADVSMVNLEWWQERKNLGDYLSVVIHSWMLQDKNIDAQKRTHKTIHLLETGSLIGLTNADAVIWGSGIHCIGSAAVVYKHRKFVKYDIRALRGPITRDILHCAGYKTADVFGDPAILMPIIYQPAGEKKRFEYTLIRHYSIEDSDNHGCNLLSIETNDYKGFIDTLQASHCVISSSLHGIILAESYGIPAIFLNELDTLPIKFYDWYYSTGRYKIKMAYTVEQAKSMEPMELPNLELMRDNLVQAFPYDLWRS